MPSRDVEVRLGEIHDGVSASVHELITCGGAQFDLMASLVPQILASNEDFFAPEVRDRLPLSAPPFTPNDAGWVMAPNEKTNFVVEFLPPGAAPDAPAVRGDLFRLDSYFGGVHVTQAPTGEDFLRAPNEKQTFTLAWDGPGPLASLLDPAAVEAKTLSFHFNVADLQALFLYRGGDDPLPDIGPLQRSPARGARALHLRLTDAPRSGAYYY